MESTNNLPAVASAGARPCEAGDVTKAKARDYVKQGGGFCLFCGSHEIEGGSYDYETPELGQKVTCLACGRSWVDVYVLTRVEVAG